MISEYAIIKGKIKDRFSYKVTYINDSASLNKDVTLVKKEMIVWKKC